MTLKVLHPPSCRLRKEFRQSGEVKEDLVEVARKAGGDDDDDSSGEVLLLRCDVTEAEPRKNITFSWYHDGRLLRAGGAAVLALPGSAEGSYSCEARNTVGAGPRCPIKVRPRPVAALVAETGYSTYLLFGAGAVACVLVAGVAAAAFCRRMALGKYDYPPTAHDDNDDGANNNLDSNYDTRDADCVVSNHASSTTPLPPPAVMANGSMPRHHQGILKSSNGHASTFGNNNSNSRPQHLDNSTLTRNGVCRGAPAPPSYHNNHHYGTYGSNKRVTMNRHHMMEQEAVVDDVVDVDAVMNELMMEEEEEMVYPPPPPPTGILRGGRTAMGMRGGHPRELWLV